MDTQRTQTSQLGVTGRRVGRHSNENGTGAVGRLTTGKATTFQTKEEPRKERGGIMGQTLKRTSTFLDRVASPG
jgi:hypothetical protein